MRIADDTEAIGRRYRELFRPSSEQLSPPKTEPRDEIGRRDDVPLRPACQ